MSINGPPPDEEDEDEEDDNQHKAWETRAAIAHLLGLCEALETVERSASGGDHRLATLSARRPSFKGKEREVNGPPAGRAAGASPLQALVRRPVWPCFPGSPSPSSGGGVSKKPALTTLRFNHYIAR